MKPKGTKRETLQYFAKWKAVTTFNVMYAFNLSYSGAKLRIWRLGKERLIECEISPDGKTKNWWLTKLGWERLLILCSEGS